MGIKPRLITEETKDTIRLLPQELDFFSADRRVYAPPLRLTAHYFSLIDVDDPCDPLRRQCIPSIAEFSSKPYENCDPLDEHNHSPLLGMVHRYPDRVLFLVTTECAQYCRHCFRRHKLHRQNWQFNPRKLNQAVRYINTYAAIKEILLSGGDPLFAPESLLAAYFTAFKKINRPVLIRIGTRIPVVYPEIINGALLNLLEENAPLWISLQFNHPRELAPASLECIRRLKQSGAELVNQTVLLRGVNDDPAVLIDLCEKLVRAGIKPLYLFQGDLAAGTAHFRTNLRRSLTIYKKLWHSLSGLGRPLFGLDLPGGGGKICLSPFQELAEQDGWYLIPNTEGKTFRYPVEDDTL